MTLDEKSGREASSDFTATKTTVKSLVNLNDDSYTFSDVVNKACEGLMERQITYTIRRILDMEKRLSEMEQELDEFLKLRTGN
ncbi:MAG: hypothetical protein FWC22_02810 [Treponema sp.]|nr:hypothetical protein [Treponema sp.]